MARRPVVGITAYGREGGPRGEQFSLPSAYVDAVRAAGGLPVLLAPGAGAAEEAAEEAAASLDGVVFSGGGDIDPARTGGGHDTNYMVDAERDAFEVALLDAALAHELPVLAICRGLQVLNAVRGGTLHAHLPEVFGESVPHRAPPLDPVRHGVAWEAGARLAGLHGAADMEVASWHHQGVDRLGEGLRAVAWAPDGVVEAVELDGAPFVLAVQWHPELHAPGDPPRRIFSELAALARRRSR